MSSLLSPGTWAEGDISFARDIRPILSDNCFRCHGPSEKQRKAKLRLDIAESAMRDRDGHAAIVPGKPNESVLIARIFAGDPDEVMPPPASHKTLSQEQKTLLSRWIEEGADYKRHWAFVTPTRPAAPVVENATWIRNPIDSFVLGRLERNGLTPASRANRETLIRRVALDLTGLPPTLAEIDAFLEDDGKKAYEGMVEHYLQTDRYGEHMARYWLDLGRYADSNGYQYDKERTQWPWRDWVIHAYNSNKPFDEFTIEQLAGDLLPDATLEQQVATGFNRNHPITIEGGVIDEEYRVEYVMDRVVTTGQTWLAMSLGCARCHDHKFDPISQDEFYQMFAFFNQVPERGLSGFEPQLPVRAPAAQAEIAESERALMDARAAAIPSASDVAAWESALLEEAAWQAHPPAPGPSINVRPEGSAFTAVRVEPVPQEGVDIQVIPEGGEEFVGRYVRVSVPGPKRYLGLAEVQVFSGSENVAQGRTTSQSTTGYGGTSNRAVDGDTNGVYAANSVTHTTQQRDPWWEVDLSGARVINRIIIWNRTDCCSERLDGFSIQILDKDREVVWQKHKVSAPSPEHVFILGGPVPVAVNAYEDTWLPPTRITVPEGATVKVGLSSEGVAEYSVFTSNAESWQEFAVFSPETKEALATPATRRTTAQQEHLRKHLRDKSPSQSAVRQEISDLESDLAKLKDQPATKMLVMRDLQEPRKTFFLGRGQYDQRRHEVGPNTPAFLGRMSADMPRNRLGFAQWLVASNHPLTARVAMNRYWQRYFGKGLVRTLEEFGSQGAWPSHPELLDWLATEFVRSGWNVKAMQRLILTSATYQQVSSWHGSNAGSDPENILLARGARFRLDAEVIRDSVLAVSGLIDDRLGGPSVYPYQPEGLWMEANNRPNLSRAYPPPAEEQLYRRSMYTYWKRTLPHPQMQTFDAPNREICTNSRSRTNTPLQALALMNDPQYVEAARHLAARMLREGGTTEQSRMTYGFRLTTSRTPSGVELRMLSELLKAERQRFSGAPEKARVALSVGFSKRDETLDLTEHAAWFTLARLLLNVDEVINKS